MAIGCRLSAISKESSSFRQPKGRTRPTREPIAIPLTYNL